MVSGTDCLEAGTTGVAWTLVVCCQDPAAGYRAVKISTVTARIRTALVFWILATAYTCRINVDTCAAVPFLLRSLILWVPLPFNAFHVLTLTAPLRQKTAHRTPFPNPSSILKLPIKLLNNLYFSTPPHPYSFPFLPSFYQNTLFLIYPSKFPRPSTNLVKYW